MFIVESHSAEETERLGSLLGRFLHPGSSVALYGDLGGGKTCFTRGLVSSILPHSTHLVASPTFAIMNEYSGEKPVYHFDFYRLAGSSDVFEMGFDEYFAGDGICIIEWAERLEELLPKDSITITFEYLESNKRILKFNATGSESAKALKLFQTTAIR